MKRLIVLAAVILSSSLYAQEIGAEPDNKYGTL